MFIRKLLSAVLLICFAISGLFADIGYIEYECKPGDSLASIAEELYSSLDNSEHNPEDNSYRSVLILRTNRDLFPDILVYTSLKTNSPIYPGKDVILKIPVYNDRYPTKEMLFDLVIYEKKYYTDKIRNKYEYYPVRKQEDMVNSRILYAVFSFDDKNDALYEEAEFYHSNYILPDNTAIPGQPRNEKDIFVWKINESPQNSKTVFLFADDLQLPDLSLSGLNLVNSIFRYNSSKKGFLLLPRNYYRDYEPYLNEIYSIISENYPDFGKILENRIIAVDKEDTLYLDISPVFLYSQFNQNAEPVFLYDSNEFHQRLDSLYEESQAEQKTIFSDYSDEKQKLDRIFEDYVKDQTKLYITDTEKEIINSYGKLNRKDEVILSEINRLQINFADIYKKSSGLIFSNENENPVTAILKKIDSVFLSSTLGIYKSYLEKISNQYNSNRESLAKNEKRFSENIRQSNTRLSAQMERLYDLELKKTLNLLPENSFAVYETDSGKILDLLNDIDQENSFNIVIYFSPVFDREIRNRIIEFTDITLPEVISFDDFILPENYFDDIIYPENYTEENYEDKTVRQIRYGFYFLKNLKSFRDYPSVSADNVCICEYKLTGTGSIYRICQGLQDNKSVTSFLFVPGEDYPSRNTIIENNFSGILSSKTVKALLKFNIINETLEDI